MSDGRAARPVTGNSVMPPFGVTRADLLRLGEPDVAVRTFRHAGGSAVAGRNGEVGDHAGGRDAADLVGGGDGEPDVAVRARRDVAGIGGDGVHLDRPRRRDAADRRGVELNEPEVAVGAGGDRADARGGAGNRKLGHRARGRDAPDLVVDRFAEPEIAVAPAAMPYGIAGEQRHGERGDRALTAGTGGARACPRVPPRTRPRRHRSRRRRPPALAPAVPPNPLAPPGRRLPLPPGAPSASSRAGRAPAARPAAHDRREDSEHATLASPA